MAGLSPWLAVAAFGALHGLNPASGWVVAAAWGVHSRDRSRALFALLPITLGHAASVAIVAGTVLFGLSLDATTLQVLAACLLLLAVALHLSGRSPVRMRAPAGNA